MIDSNALKGPLGKSLISLVIIVVFLCYLTSTILSPILNTSQEVKETQTDSLIEQHADYIAVDIARFNGRSAFFKPIRKPKTREVVRGPVTPLLPPPPPPTFSEPEAPPTYMGPPLIAIIGEEAWFRGSGSGINAVIRIKIGEEKEGIFLESTAEPAMAIVGYRRGVYEIDLFSHEETFFRVDAPEMTTPDFLEEVEESDPDTPSI